MRLLGPERGPRLLERLIQLRAVRTCGGGEVDLPDQLDQQIGFFESLTEHPEDSQRRLCAARVAVVGVGGIGSVVLQHLLGAGVRKFLLVDGDTVEPSNLNRQFLYSPGDVGRPKVDVVSEYLGAYDDVDLTVLPEYVRGPGQLEQLHWGPDSVVGAADHPPGAIHDWLGAYARASGAGYLSCGVGVHRGYWGPLVRPGVTPCLECAAAAMALLPAREEFGSGHDPLRVTVSFGPVNTVVGAAVSADIILDLAGLLPREHARSLNVVDLYRRRFTRLPGPHRRPGCRVDGCVEARAE